MSCSITIDDAVIYGKTNSEMTANVTVDSTEEGKITMSIPDGIGLVFEDTGTTQKKWDCQGSGKQKLKFTLTGTDTKINFTATYTFESNSSCSDSDDNQIRLN